MNKINEKKDFIFHKYKMNKLKINFFKSFYFIY